MGPWEALDAAWDLFGTPTRKWKPILVDLGRALSVLKSFPRESCQEVQNCYISKIVSMASLRVLLGPCKLSGGPSFLFWKASGSPKFLGRLNEGNSRAGVL